MTLGRPGSPSGIVEGEPFRPIKALEQQASEILRESEERLRLFIATAPAAIAMFDRQMRYLAASGAWLREHGLREEVAGLSHYDVVPWLPEKWRQSHQRALAGSIERCEEDRWVRPDGSTAWAKWEVRPWPTPHGEVGGVVIFVQDITPSKAAEAGLRDSQEREHARRVESEALMAAAPMIVWIAHDPDCRVITGNPAGEAMLRVPAGRNLSKTAPESERPQHFQVFRDGKPVPDQELSMQVAGRTGKPVFGVEQEIRYADGTSCWIYGNAVPLLKTDGTVRGVVATFVDITERRRTETDLQASRGQLRALAGRLQAVREEERSRLAREFHDVLAQDLTRLKLDIAWLERRLAEPVEDRTLMRDKLAGMSELADGAIGAVQRIATELRPVVLDTLGLAAAIEWQVKDFEARTGIGCRIQVPGNELRIERAGSTAVFRILQESLTNVARHAQATQVEVELRCEKEQLILSVADNGRGIRAAELSDVHSMGLLGMRERATLLGGHCEIASRPEGGTKVQVRMPLSAGGPETLR